MDHLVRRTLSDRVELIHAVQALFCMLLAPFTLAGAYPREESVSDLALQIWFSILECDLDQSDSTEGIDTTIQPSLLQGLHISFLERAFIKVLESRTGEQKKWDAARPPQRP
ncbi:unnamed protein product [Echinostoma caproni]|uniref:Secreted protein n=1 Tax=Echinostoma caproni TaxID=27848 RepID=A0A183AXP9_9TREM|nr:unnamed protein product [Echinostoma caproni]